MKNNDYVHPDYPHGITEERLQKLQELIKESCEYLSWGIRTCYTEGKLQNCQDKITKLVGEMNAIKK